MNFVAQYMHNLSQAHFSMVKHILRYVQGTTTLKLQLFAPSICMPLQMLTEVAVQKLDISQLDFVPSSVKIISLGAPKNSTQYPTQAQKLNIIVLLTQPQRSLGRPLSFVNSTFH